MTTRKAYQKPILNVSFQRPTIGPRVYLSRGPAGRLETFQREDADAALANFLDPLRVEELFDAFWTMVRIDNDLNLENWEHVRSYLGKITQQLNAKIPADVAVAFWAQAMLHRDTANLN